MKKNIFTKATFGTHYETVSGRGAIFDSRLPNGECLLLVEGTSRLIPYGPDGDPGLREPEGYRIREGNEEDIPGNPRDNY